MMASGSADMKPARLVRKSKTIYRARQAAFKRRDSDADSSHSFPIVMARSRRASIFPIQILKNLTIHAKEGPLMKLIMLRTTTLCLITLAGFQNAMAQSSMIDVTTYRDKVRFESQAPTREFRVEVFNALGQKLFDSGFVAGQTLDWNMLDQQGEPVADGVYDYLVTTRKRNGKANETQSAQLSILREGRNLENAPVLAQPAAAGSGVGSGNVTGSGAAGQFTKWTGTTTLTDSVLTEKDGKIGLATTNPVSLLHILGSHPVTSTLTGTNATEGLRIIGGKGGDTSGSGQMAGNGANLVLQAGDGGDALTGTSGRGGYVTIQPGGAGVGSIGGGFGQVILAPGGGNVGIGVTNAGSKLTVAGMIETTLGGLKFPDGTMQTTAATTGLTSIFHDASLAGLGTSGSPLRVAVGGIGNLQLALGAVEYRNIAPGEIVSNLNGLRDGVTLSAGPNVTITPSDHTLTIGAALGTAYFSRANLSTGVLNDPGQDVVSKTIPAGSYVILAKLQLSNVDDDSQFVTCSMSNSLEFWGDRIDSNKRVIVTFQQSETFFGETMITVHCTGFNVFASNVALTAIKVDSIH